MQNKKKNFANLAVFMSHCMFKQSGKVFYSQVVLYMCYILFTSVNETFFDYNKLLNEVDNKNRPYSYCKVAIICKQDIYGT